MTTGTPRSTPEVLQEARDHFQRDERGKAAKALLRGGFNNDQISAVFEVFARESDLFKHRNEVGPNAPRIHWLEAAYCETRQSIYPEALPPKAVNVTYGFPSRGARARTKKILGECFDDIQDANARILITIHPLSFRKPIDVLANLLHESIHAAVGLKAGHRGEFGKTARRLGFETPLTPATPSPWLAARLNVVLERLPAYPRGWGDITNPPKQSTRLRLWVCRCPLPVKVRVASDDFQARCLKCQGLFHRGGAA